MKKLKLFLDTSVYSAFFDKRDSNRQKLTQDFWKNIDDYDLFYSTINKEEIEAVSDINLKNKMITLLEKGYMIEITDEAKRLTKIYIKEEIVPDKYENDALLLALTKFIL